MKILQIFLYLATVFLWAANLNAQYLPVSMETKIANAEIIVEGRISGQQFFESKGEFFTENLLDIKQVIKGKINTRTISVVTLGGELDGTRRTWTHLPSFSQNEYGVFFLTPTKYEVGEHKSHLYEIFSGSQGYYRISNYDGKIMAVSAIETFDSLQDLYQALGEIRKNGNESPFEISGNKKNCLKIKIVPKFDLPTGEETPQFIADIFVKSTGESVKLHSINVIAKYDTIAFGNNLVNANNLSFTEGDLVTNYYSLDLTDYSSNQLKLNYAANGTQFSSLESIDNEYKKLGTLSLNIQGFSIDEPITLDEEAAILNNYYIDENGFVKEFYCTDFYIGSACDLDVTGMTSTMVVPGTNTPMAAAGVGESSLNGIPGVVRITGINFGEGDGIKPPEGHRVKFRTVETDADGNKIGWIAPFEGDYLEWTNSQIVVKVPSFGYIDDTQNPITNPNKQIAATGTVRVCMDEDDMLCECFDDTNEILYIPFSARNNVRTNADLELISSPFILRNLNAAGGYTFYFGSGFDGISDNDIFSRERFENALTTWRCNTFVNFDLDKIGNHPNPTNPPDGTGLIFMDSTLPFGTLGSTQINEDICESIHSTASSFVIRISTVAAWFDDDFPDFLESTILHELGHAHLLMHTCNGKDKVMHPSSAPIDPTELSNDDLNGGVHETTLGTITTIDCDENAQMIPLTAGDCFLPVIDIQGKEIAYEVFPNPTSNNVVVSFDSWENSILGKIVVFNSLGVEQFIHPKITQFNTLNFSDLNAGIYFIALVRETNEIQFLSTIQKN